MTATCRSLAGLGLLFATLAGLGPAQSARLGELARELCRLPEVQAQMESQGQRRANLHQNLAIALERIRAKDAIVGALIAGRLNLFEAAASFQALNRRLPPAVEFGRDLRRCRSDTERYCRQVLAWTRNKANRRPPGTIARLVQRLEADLEDHLRRDGDVRLPAVDSSLTGG
jgi:hypothetical protein